MIRYARAIVAVLGAVGAISLAGGASAADPWFERSFVEAAGARCGLFQPQVQGALRVAALQARGAALRAGSDEAAVSATRARARSRAAVVACDDPELQVVRQRVDHAFSGWAGTPRMVFEGWSADRYRRVDPNWSLTQASVTGASPVAFGFAGAREDQALTAVVSFVGRPRPTHARLVMRDPAKAPRAWLSGSGLAPEAIRASVWSSGQAPAARSLLTVGRTQGEAWTFPVEAARMIERLDSREAFAIEFHFRDGSVATARFQAADFAAGRAFLSMGMI